MKKSRIRVVPWSDSNEWHTIISFVFSRERSKTLLARQRLIIWNERLTKSLFENQNHHQPSISQSLLPFVDLLLDDPYWSSWYEKDKKAQTIENLDLDRHSFEEEKLRLCYSLSITKFINHLVDPLGVNLNSGARLLDLPQELISIRLLTSHYHLPDLLDLREGFTLCLEWIYENYFQAPNQLEALLAQYPHQSNIQQIDKFVYAHVIHLFHAKEIFFRQMYASWKQISAHNTKSEVSATFSASWLPLLRRISGHFSQLPASLLALCLDAGHYSNEEESRPFAVEADFCLFLTIWLVLHFDFTTDQIQDFQRLIHLNGLSTLPSIDALKLLDILRELLHQSTESIFPLTLPVGYCSVDLQLDTEWDQLHDTVNVSFGSKMADTKLTFVNQAQLNLKKLKVERFTPTDFKPSPTSILQTNQSPAFIIQNCSLSNNKTQKGSLTNNNNIQKGSLSDSIHTQEEEFPKKSKPPAKVGMLLDPKQLLAISQKQKQDKSNPKNTPPKSNKHSLNLEDRKNNPQKKKTHPNWAHQEINQPSNRVGLLLDPKQMLPKPKSKNK